jgi:hypothetical protein
MDADPTQAYNQDDATGFIHLNALRLKVAAHVHTQKNKTKKQKKNPPPPPRPPNDYLGSWLLSAFRSPTKGMLGFSPCASIGPLLL